MTKQELIDKWEQRRNELRDRHTVLLTIRDYWYERRKEEGDIIKGKVQEINAFLEDFKQLVESEEK